MAHQDGTAAQQAQRRPMNEGIVVAGAHDGQVIGVARDVLEQVGNLQSGLAVSLKRESRAHQLRIGRLDELQRQIVGFEAVGQRLAIALLQLRFRIESVHVARAALHEQENDTFGRGGKRRPFRCEQTRQGRSRCAAGRIAGKQIPQGHRAKAQGGLGQKLTPIQSHCTPAAG